MAPHALMVFQPQANYQERAFTSGSVLGLLTLLARGPRHSSVRCGLTCGTAPCTQLKERSFVESGSQVHMLTLDSGYELAIPSSVPQNPEAVLSLQQPKPQGVLLLVVDTMRPHTGTSR